MDRGTVAWRSSLASPWKVASSPRKITERSVSNVAAAAAAVAVQAEDCHSAPSRPQSGCSTGLAVALPSTQTPPPSLAPAPDAAAVLGLADVVSSLCAVAVVVDAHLGMGVLAIAGVRRPICLGDGGGRS